jgi:hypothetical protein
MSQQYGDSESKRFLMCVPANGTYTRRDLAEETGNSEEGDR